MFAIMSFVHPSIVALVSGRRGAPVRAAIRREVGVRNSAVSVSVVPGADAPAVIGADLPRGHYTRGGTPIRHPGAYSRRGRSNMVYHCDGRTITVGAEWLRANV